MKTPIEKLFDKVHYLDGRLQEDVPIITWEDVKETVENHTCLWTRGPGGNGSYLWIDCTKDYHSSGSKDSFTYCPRCMGRIIEETE